MLKYEYLIFDRYDKAQLPLSYETLESISKYTGMSKKQLQDKFYKNNNVFYFGTYGFERFKKEKGLK